MTDSCLAWTDFLGGKAAQAVCNLLLGPRLNGVLAGVALSLSCRGEK